jgi:hypothetical protein
MTPIFPLQVSNPTDQCGLLDDRPSTASATRPRGERASASRGRFGSGARRSGDGSRWLRRPEALTRLAGCSRRPSARIHCWWVRRHRKRQDETSRSVRIAAPREGGSPPPGGGSHGQTRTIGRADPAARGVEPARLHAMTPCRNLDVSDRSVITLLFRSPSWYERHGQGSCGMTRRAVPVRIP